jgi:N-methylhydantoinase B
MLPSKCDRVKVEVGDLLLYETWGGGGWGDPFKRPVENVEFDVRAGLVSVEGARRYGVVVSEDFVVDGVATEALRKTMTEERGDTMLFDRGGTIDELKARCLEETGLEPPVTPVFQKWVATVAG